MPELAVLLAYTKIELFERRGSDVPEDPFLRRELEAYFPEAVRDRFGAQIDLHPLRREIVATRSANGLVDHAGTSFAFRLAEETGMGPAEIARAHTAAREVFGQPALWMQVRALDGSVPTDVQVALFLDVRRIVERGSRWLLRNRRQPLDIAATVAFFAPGVPELAARLPELLTPAAAELLAATVAGHVEAGAGTARPAHRGTARGVLGARRQRGCPSERVPARRRSGRPLRTRRKLRLDWLRQRILELPRDDRWQALARGALRDSLYGVHAALTAEVLRAGEGRGNDKDRVLWLARPAATPVCGPGERRRGRDGSVPAVGRGMYRLTVLLSASYSLCR